jgi:hypothetical protein
MFASKTECFAAVILLTICLNLTGGSEVQVLKLGILNEDMEADMESMKNGRVRWLDGIPQFVEKLKHIKEATKALHDGESWPVDTQSISTLLQEYRSKLPVEYSFSELYKTHGLRELELEVRILIEGIASNPRDNGVADWHCFLINIHTESNLNEKNLTIHYGCPNLQTCPKLPRPFDPTAHIPELQKDEDLRDACNDDKTCNINKALPMMTGIFYGKIYQMIGFYICCEENQEAQNECQKFPASYEAVLSEADILIAFAHSHPDFWKPTWDTFFNTIISSNALVDVHTALSLIEENKIVFESSNTICKYLNVPEACVYHDTYKQYQLLVKKQERQNLPKFVKDLRLHSEINLAKMTELQALKLNQIELLGSIDGLDENLESSTVGISKYLGDMAKFDQGIAEADAGFIKGSLENYTIALREVENKLTTDLLEAQKYMVGVLAANLAEKVVLLGVSVATNSNPLKLIFSGPDVVDIVERANDIADATVDLVHGMALINAVINLAWDSSEFSEAFLGNEQQISHLESVKSQILNDQENDLNQDADQFLQEYAAYTPLTDRSRLSHNNALWSAFKDSTCDLLSTQGGIATSVIKGTATTKLLCERLEGTLAQFFTLREDIFDFQFQLVDAIAGVVRGNIAQRLAEGIKGKVDVVSGAQLLIGSFLTQNILQTTASTYCDVIEYRRLGRPYTSGCATFQGLFTSENLDNLIAYTRATGTDHEIERYVTIPTQSSFPGDTAYVDLNSLASGNEVIFKLPKNTTWLHEHRWVAPGQSETQVPFVKSFELFLPHKTYESGSIPSESTVAITIQSIAGSYITTLNPSTGVSYLLPRGSGKYVTVYEENYSRCPKEIENPYSLCDNLPGLCLLSSRHPGSDALLPTTLSTWSIHLKRTQGSRKLTWEAPHPTTTLLLHARVVFLAPSSKKNRRKFALFTKKKSDVVPTENGCCDGNKYRLKERMCKSCPGNSTAVLRGVYCEIDQPDMVP